MPTFPLLSGTFFTSQSQPINGVVSIRRMIHRRRIKRPVQRSSHHIIALRFVLAPHILHDADVSTLKNHFEGIIVSIKNLALVCARRMTRLARRAVRSTGQQNRRILRAFGNHDYGV